MPSTFPRKIIRKHGTRAPPKRRHHPVRTCPSSKLLHHTRVFGYQGPMRTLATKRQQTHATLGERNTCRSDGRGNGAAGCRGRRPARRAPLPRLGGSRYQGRRHHRYLPGTRSAPRALDRHVIARSLHPYRHRSTVLKRHTRIVFVFTANVFCLQQYYASIDFILQRSHMIRNNFR